MNLKYLLYSLLIISISTTVFAQSPSKDWNSSYQFSGPSGTSVRMLQADIIERKDNGYYDSFGPGDLTVNNFLTNTVGTLNSYNTRIDGQGNSVINDSTSNNYGNLDGSINITNNSILSSTEKFSSVITNISDAPEPIQLID